MVRQRESGFTLIELLVVILIVAILAAVAIPVFLRQRQKGYEDQIRSALKNAATAVESYATENNGDYSGLDELTQADPSLLTQQGFPMPEWAQTPPDGLLDVEASTTEYCIRMRHDKLTEDSAWRRSTYQSAMGEPQPTPDSCPELTP